MQCTTPENGENPVTYAVLLIDDDENILHGLARALRHQPYRIYTAMSGEEAKLALKSRPIDVVVTDEQMPGMPGGDLLAWIAEQCPEVMRIVLTGHPTVEAAIRAINEGRVYQFFTKPCSPVELGVAIRKALEHKELVKQHARLSSGQRRHAERIERFQAELTRLKDILARDIHPFLQSMAHGRPSPPEENECGLPASETSPSLERAVDGLTTVGSIVDTLIERCEYERPLRQRPHAGCASG